MDAVPQRRQRALNEGIIVITRNNKERGVQTREEGIARGFIWQRFARKPRLRILLSLHVYDDVHVHMSVLMSSRLPNVFSLSLLRYIRHSQSMAWRAPVMTGSKSLLMS